MQTVLVAGASGLVGSAAVAAYLEAGWRVIALSRRAPPVEPHPRLHHRPVDLRDAAACARLAADHCDTSRLVYAAVEERPGLIAGWFDPETIDANDRMLGNVLDPLAANGALRHVALLQGGKAYGPHFHPVAVPAREDGPRDPHDNFYWRHEDRVRALSATQGVRYTVFRPPLIVGGATGAAMNVLVPFALWGALCRQAVMPFGFPGGPHNPFDVVDTRLIARAMLWAADSAAAADQIFNITNGELCDWATLWPVIGDALGLPPAPASPRSLAATLPAAAADWAALAARRDLAESDITALLGQSHFYADMFTGYGVEAPPPPFIMSSIKIRQAGFAECMDTRDTMRFWLGDLVRRRIIPPIDRVVEQAA